MLGREDNCVREGGQLGGGGGNCVREGRQLC